MTSVMKNGQPSMEEILASIRRIVADEPHGAVPLIDLNGRNAERLPGIGVEDGADFELPSMFRHRRTPVTKPSGGRSQILKSGAAPIGRLTDAIRSVAPKSAGQAAKLREPQAQTQAAGVVPQAGAGSSLNGANGQAAGDVEPADAAFGIRPKAQQALSSLSTNGQAGLGQRTETAPVYVAPSAGAAATGQVQGSGQASGLAAEQVALTSVTGGSNQNQTASQSTTQQTMGSGAKTSMSKAPPRVMAPFRDTRMNQMAASEPSSPSASTAPTPDAAPSAHSTSGSGIGSIVPGALDLPGREPGAAESQATPVTDAVPVTTQDARDGASEAGAHSHGFGSSPGSELEANPPPLPHEGDAAAQHVEDATADLLRPMLRQWLTDNMPRMVEKALHIEVAETVRTSKNHDPS